MKTLRTLSLAMVIALAFASCGSEKKVVTQEPQQQQTIQQPAQVQQPTQQQSEQSLPETPPCGDYYDDGEYIRVGGVGTNINPNFAKSFATDNAKKEMNERVFNIIQTISNCDLYDINFEDISQKLQQNGILTPPGSVVCVMHDRQETGHYTYYVTMQFSKETTKVNIIGELNTIAKEQNLGIDFNEEKFVNYMNKIMDIK